jgi:L-ascorbate metabolism protein UlaG (beta-lactamase superfamily)
MDDLAARAPDSATRRLAPAPPLRSWLTPTICLTLAAGALTAAHPPAPAVRNDLAITFLANEGVLLSGRDRGTPRTVLIDALFEPYESYAVPPDSAQSALRTARAPYDAVDLILVTHRHGDHFHPAPVAQHLRSSARAVLVTSREVVDSLRGRLTPELVRSERIAARTMPAGTRRTLLVNGITVQLFGLPHGGRRHRHVEHIAYLVELGGRRVLHVGDAELSEASLAPFRLDTMGIDVALLPHWALTDEETRRAVARWIRPGRIAALHLAAGDTRTAREVRAAEPQAHAFLRPLERVTW